MHHHHLAVMAREEEAKEESAICDTVSTIWLPMDRAGVPLAHFACERVPLSFARRKGCFTSAQDEEEGIVRCQVQRAAGDDILSMSCSSPCELLHSVLSRRQEETRRHYCLWISHARDEIHQEEENRVNAQIHRASQKCTESRCRGVCE